MVEWKQYTPKCHPTKSGRYLTLYKDCDNEVFPCTDYYFKKGSLMGVRKSDKDTFEERIFDVLFNPELEIIAPESGFYEVDEEHAHRIMPDFWAECPEPPEGYSYDVDGLWGEEE